MLKKLIIILVLGLGVIGRAQGQSYFNERLTLHSYGAGLTSVVESNGRYYCTGFGYDSLNLVNFGNAYARFGIKFTVFDLAGNILTDSLFQLPWRDLGTFNSNLNRLSDGTFVMASEDIDTTQLARLIVVRFDSLGHMLNYKELNKPLPLAIADSPGFWQVQDLKPTGINGQWLMLSSLECLQSAAGGGYQLDFLLTKLDSNFNVIWNKQYGDNKDDYAGKLLIEGDHYILAGGNNSYNIYPQNISFKAEIFKTDTAGNQLSRALINNPKITDKISDIIRTRDGSGYVYCGAGEGYEDFSPNVFHHSVYFRGWAQKLDTNFNVVWSRSLDSQEGSIFRKVYEKPNGEIALFGDKYEPVVYSSTNYEIHTKGWYARLKSNGDTICKRTYYKVRSCYDRNSFYDAKETSDGGYVMVGESTDDCNTVVSPSQRAWIVKVDSNGCVGGGDPQCWPLSVSHAPVRSVNIYKLYPNPTQGIVTVDYTNESHEGSVLNIIDLTGRIITTHRLSGKSGKLPLDISYLQPGIYLYQILEKGLPKAQGKITRQ